MGEDGTLDEVFVECMLIVLKSLINLIVITCLLLCLLVDINYVCPTGCTRRGVGRTCSAVLHTSGIATRVVPTLYSCMVFSRGKRGVNKSLSRRCRRVT